ncbi:MAG TPA: hypothetical protein VKP11_00725 [Frankiaceae bacterium]|nr:hypothetical protein [Frankiaceae bacterium]
MNPSAYGGDTGGRPQPPPGALSGLPGAFPGLPGAGRPGGQPAPGGGAAPGGPGRQLYDCGAAASRT